LKFDFRENAHQAITDGSMPTGAGFGHGSRVAGGSWLDTTRVEQPRCGLGRIWGGGWFLAVDLGAGGGGILKVEQV
jgi:hypothetical protein